MLIFFEIIFPILVVFFIGYVIQSKLSLDIKTISTLALYVFTPCLVFHTIYMSTLNFQHIYIISFVFFLLIITIIVSKIYVRIRKMSIEVESGLILSTAFMNSGNFGMPIILFAYGESNLEYAISFFVISQIFFYSVGLYYAARGTMSIKLAIKAVAINPMIYAVFFSLLFNLLDIPISRSLLSMVSIIGDAAIPSVMLVLGMQLAHFKIKNFDWGNMAFVVGMRLFLAPLIAYGIVQMLSIDLLLQKILIILAALPTASSAALLAIQYDAEGDLVSGATFITTMISILSVTLLIFILK